MLNKCIGLWVNTVPMVARIFAGTVKTKCMSCIRTGPDIHHKIIVLPPCWLCIMYSASGNCSFQPIMIKFTTLCIPPSQNLKLFSNSLPYGPLSNDPSDTDGCSRQPAYIEHNATRRHPSQRTPDILTKNKKQYRMLHFGINASRFHKVEEDQMPESAPYILKCAQSWRLLGGNH